MNTPPGTAFGALFRCVDLTFGVFSEQNNRHRGGR